MTIILILSSADFIFILYIYVYLFISLCYTIVFNIMLAILYMIYYIYRG